MPQQYSDITAFAPAVLDTGYRNQILGAFGALSDITGISQNPETSFLLPPDIATNADLKESFCFAKCRNYEDFRQKFFVMTDNFMQNTPFVPRIFITVYNLTEGRIAGVNVDMFCRAVKEYYSKNHLGTVLTAVLSSRLHKYKYVDLINIPKHLLTFTSRIRLLQNKKLRRKVLITVGTVNNFSRSAVREKNKELLDKIHNLKNDPDIGMQIAKLETFRNTGKKVVFCLGGRVEGNEIVFDLNYVKRLYANAEILSRHGYGIVFVNGPRTPNDVTDFLYEKTLQHPNIIFQNSKKIAENDDDRTPRQWRIYSGKHEDDFRKMQKLGNIYPGIAGFNNTLVVHSADTYASCETANAALPTAVSIRGLYVDPSVRYDCLNLFKLLCPKYAIDFDEFVHFACNMNIEPDDLRPQILSSPLRVFAETLINRLNAMDSKSR